MVSSNELWDNLAPKTIFYEFRRCLRNENRDVWNRLLDNEMGENEEWATQDGFEAILQTFVQELLLESAGTRQKQYMRTTGKPRGTTVRAWVSRIQFINAWLPFMEEDCTKFSERELILEVITPDIPTAWQKDY